MYFSYSDSLTMLHDCLTLGNAFTLAYFRIGVNIGVGVLGEGTRYTVFLGL